ncbi:hypothetical protein D3C85_1747710 [compost metagenome]
MPPLILGRIVHKQGRMMPGMVLTLNTAPTNIAPELPALANESILPSFKRLKPTAMLELGF